MFILRQIRKAGQGSESNQILGDSYHFISRENHLEEFERAKNHHYKDCPDPDCDGQLYAFLIYNEGAVIYPLYKGSENYIMTSDGKTFKNITFR